MCQPKKPVKTGADAGRKTSDIKGDDSIKLALAKLSPEGREILDVFRIKNIFKRRGIILSEAEARVEAKALSELEARAEAKALLEVEARAKAEARAEAKAKHKPRAKRKRHKKPGRNAA